MQAKAGGAPGARWVTLVHCGSPGVPELTLVHHGAVWSSVVASPPRISKSYSLPGTSLNFTDYFAKQKCLAQHTFIFGILMQKADGSSDQTYVCFFHWNYDFLIILK